MYKLQPHPKLSQLLKTKFTSLYKASLALEMKYDRLLNIARGRAHPANSEVALISATLKKTAREIGFKKVSEGGLDPAKECTP
jgi:hypothetical protein